MTAEDPAARIADALARLRPPRPAPPGFGGGHPHGGHGRGWSLRGAATPSDLGGLREEIARRRGEAPGGGDGPRGAAGPIGRSVARVRLLEVLAEARVPLSIGAIAERLHVDQPRASRIVQAAVHLGLTRREPDPADARRTLVALTDEGRAALERARGARAGAVEQALAGFTPAEREQLAALLSRLAEAWPRPGR